MTKQYFKNNLQMRALVEEAKGKLNLLDGSAASSVIAEAGDVARIDCHTYFETVMQLDQKAEEERGVGFDDWTLPRLAFSVLSEASRGYNDYRWKVVDATAPNPGDWLIVVQHKKGRKMNKPGRFAWYRLSDYVEGVPESGRWIETLDGMELFSLKSPVQGSFAVAVLALQVAAHEFATSLSKGPEGLGLPA